jgi:sialic acid synthase SpsE
VIFSTTPWRREESPWLPYLMGEIGVNHGGDLDAAMAYVHEAARAGFQAVKFQSYRAATLAAEMSPAYWDLSKEPTESQRALFEKYDSLTVEDYASLSELAKSLGLQFCSTPFDHKYVDELAPLVDFFKVASADITNLPLLRHVGETGLPVVLSTGAADYREIERAIEEVDQAGAGPVCILHCVLNYPTAPEHAQLNQIPTLAAMFPGVVVGYSDHVPPQDDLPLALEHLVVASLMGAAVIEKHFTVDRTQPGNDHYHAADVSAMQALNSSLERVTALRGKSGPSDLGGQSKARRFARRGLYAAEDLEPGDALTAGKMIALRPADGCIAVEHYDDVAGRRVGEAICSGSPITWEALASESS